jgi:hypothetical protein
MRQLMEPEPFKECPQFQTCSCNFCPLDPDADKRIALPGEETCTARRSVRERIASRCPDLPRGGLTLAEVARDRRRAAARERWEALPQEERDRRLSKTYQPRQSEGDLSRGLAAGS